MTRALLPLLLALSAAPARAGFNRLEFVEGPLDGLARINDIMTQNAALPAPAPGTGRWELRLRPTWFTVSRLADTSHLDSGGVFRGESLGGIGGSASLTYGIAEHRVVYAIVTGARLSGAGVAELKPGRIQPNPPTSTVFQSRRDVFAFDGPSTMYSAGLGLGLTLGDPDRSAMLMFGGPIVRGYKIEQTYVSLSAGNGDSVETRGSGVLWGLSYGLVVESFLGRNRQWRLSNMLGSGLVFGRPEVTATVTRAGAFALGYSETGDTGSSFVPLLASQIGYEPLGLSIELLGLLGRVMPILQDGVRMTRVSITWRFAR